MGLSFGPHQSDKPATELLVDDGIAASDGDGEAAARVGGSTDDAPGGEGVVRGLVLRVTGDGAWVIAQIRAAR